MSYNRTTWVDDSLPAISAANLNKIEAGILNNGVVYDTKADLVAETDPPKYATVLGHTAINDGGGFSCYFVDSDTTTVDSYIFADVGNSGRYFVIHEKGLANVKAGGAVVSNNRTAIEGANDAAATAGANLYFPIATYDLAVLVGDPLQPTTSWVSDGAGATLRNTDLTLATDSEFIQVDGQSNLVFNHIHIDGQITKTGSGTANEDPVSFSGVEDDFTRCAGWNIKNSSEDITLFKCHTDNIYRASFRSESSSKNITHFDCRTNRNRGTFGDAYYAQLCISVGYFRCHAYDFTRIGFVFEGNAAGNQAGIFSSCCECRAEYAHDDVTGENNFGYWVENTNEIHYTSNWAINTIGGLLLSSTDSAGLSLAEGGLHNAIHTYNVSDFTGISLKGGINLNPDDNACTMNVVNAQISIPAESGFDNGTTSQLNTYAGFEIKGATTVDWTCNIIGGSVHIDNAAYTAGQVYGAITANQSSDTSSRKIVNVDNLAFTASDPAKIRTDVATGNCGFFATNGSCGYELTLRSCQQHDDTNEELTIAATAYENKLKIKIDDCRPDFIKWSGSAALIDIKNCDYADSTDDFRAAKIKSLNTDWDFFDVTCDDVEINGGSCNRLLVRDTNARTKYIGFKSNGVTYNGSLASNDTCLFQLQGVEQYRAVFNNNIFYNNDGATNTNYFIEFDDNTGDLYGAGNIFDNRITNYASLNGTLQTAPLTDVDANMPFGYFQTMD